MIAETALLMKNFWRGFVAPDGERVTVLSIGSFRLEAGEEAGLRGASGTGKTTLLNVAAGILPPDEGTVTVAGRELTTLSESARDRARAKLIGVVHQTFHLLQGFSALENVALGMAFGPGADMTRCRELLERVGLGDRLDYHPRQLSAGQQQRVAVARALAARPRLLLADEPTGSLDPARAKEAIRLLRELARENEAALLVVSHDDEVFEGFGRVVDFADVNQGKEAES